MIKDEESIDEVVEAKRQGHRFIKVILDRSRIGRNQLEVAISGAVILKGLKKGNGLGGLPEYNFEPRGGETMNFVFDRSELEFVCWLYDDQGPGYFSQKGYNRDLLASHWEEKMFIVQDVSVLEDVRGRYEFMTANPGKKRKAVSTTGIEEMAPDATLEDIDAQIAFLKKKKLQISNENIIINNTTPPPKELTYDEKVEINKKKHEEEQRKKRNDRQKRYRLKKMKTETEAKTSETSDTEKELVT